MKKVKVRVVDLGRKNLVLRWNDPVTRKLLQKCSGTGLRRQALKVAAQLERDLEGGHYVRPSRILWADFRQRYFTEKVDPQSEKYVASTATALNQLERFMQPRWVDEIDGAAVSGFQAWLRNQSLRDTSIRGYLAVIRAALRWGNAMGLVPVVPLIQMPRGAKGRRLAKGSPVKADEFERMLQVVRQVCKQHVNHWRFLLKGLWLSGLRIGEAVELSWDESAAFRVVLDGSRFPLFRIDAEAEKGRRDRWLPMTPDFAALMRTVPARQRRGRVFKLCGTRCKRPLSRRDVAVVIRRIGEAAGVIVNNDGKHASAHDLRRSFGTRWARRCMPAMLMSLMRHENINTTMSYYVEIDAEDIASELWQQYDPQNLDNKAKALTR